MGSPGGLSGSEGPEKRRCLSGRLMRLAYAPRIRVAFIGPGNTGQGPDFFSFGWGECVHITINFSSVVK